MLPQLGAQEQPGCWARWAPGGWGILTALLCACCPCVVPSVPRVIPAPLTYVSQGLWNLPLVPRTRSRGPTLPLDGCPGSPLRTSPISPGAGSPPLPRWGITPLGSSRLDRAGRGSWQVWLGLKWTFCGIRTSEDKPVFSTDKPKRAASRSLSPGALRGPRRCPVRRGPHWSVATQQRSPWCSREDQ